MLYDLILEVTHLCQILFIRSEPLCAHSRRRELNHLLRTEISKNLGVHLTTAPTHNNSFCTQFSHWVLEKEADTPSYPHCLPLLSQH